MNSAAAMLLPALLMAADAPRPTPQSIVDAAPPAAWRIIPAEELVVMDLAGGRRVVYRLAPAFAPVHVDNIRKLVRAGWFDGAAVLRVQDNYVVQWGRPEGSAPTLPIGVNALPPAEYERSASGLAFRPLRQRDSFAPEVGHVDGWPVAGDKGVRWLVHCYGMVGVGRENAPDTGSGVELYVVTGHAPRQLDRNIALVGRVLDGIEAMTGLPRGTAELGFYATAAERLPIVTVRIAGDIPEQERPVYALLDTSSATFAQWVQVRANRLDDFYIRPAGATDLCNTLPPVRKLR